MKNRLAVLAAISALAALVFASNEVVASCRAGLRLCAELILPSLFPFFVVSMLLASLGFPDALGRRVAPLARKLFGVSGAGATALILGLSGGYPLGAAYLAELERRGEIDARETERLLVFCNNSGPAFLLGAVGGAVFHSAAAGLLLYVCHALAALVAGLLCGGDGASSPQKAAKPLPFSRALAEAVRQAVTSLLSVCGFVVCFSILTGLLDAWGVIPALSSFLSSRLPLSAQAARAMLVGFFELGNGIGAMRQLPATPGNLALAAALVGWGGLSVHCQTLAVLAESGAKSAPHTAGRLLSAVFGSLFAWGFAQLGLFFRS